METFPKFLGPTLNLSTPISSAPKCHDLTIFARIHVFRRLSLRSILIESSQILEALNIYSLTQAVRRKVLIPIFTEAFIEKIYLLGQCCEAPKKSC